LISPKIGGWQRLSTVAILYWKHFVRDAPSRGSCLLATSAGTASSRKLWEKGEPPLYCILDGMEDPQNLGAILRTAEASGTHGVITRKRRAVGLTDAVARASAGAIEYLPVARVANVAQTIATLKENGIWVIGVDPSGREDYRRADFTVPVAIVIGGEGKGISELVKKRCDYLISIPMCGKINSLNASVAAALAMYEAFHQRQIDTHKAK